MGGCGRCRVPGSRGTARCRPCASVNRHTNWLSYEFNDGALRVADLRVREPASGVERVSVSYGGSIRRLSGVRVLCPVLGLATPDAAQVLNISELASLEAIALPRLPGAREDLNARTRLALEQLWRRRSLSAVVQPYPVQTMRASGRLTLLVPRAPALLHVDRQLHERHRLLADFACSAMDDGPRDQLWPSARREGIVFD